MGMDMDMACSGDTPGGGRADTSTHADSRMFAAGDPRAHSWLPPLWLRNWQLQWW
jgi:hypothetical protein